MGIKEGWGEGVKEGMNRLDEFILHRRMVI